MKKKIAQKDAAALARGKEILTQLAEIISSVDLVDSPAVLRRLGFTGAYYEEKQPKFTALSPISKFNKNMPALPEELESTGFRAARSQITNARDGRSSYAQISVHMSTESAWVSIDDVNLIFGALANMKQGDVVATDGGTIGSRNKKVVLVLPSSSQSIRCEGRLVQRASSLTIKIVRKAYCSGTIHC